MLRNRLWALCAGLLCAGFLPHAAAGPAPSVALITGANRGIGLALSTVLAQKGWRVIATCRDPAHADELRALSRKYPGVRIDALDVTDDAALKALAAKLRGQPIDLLINNAGILGSPQEQRLGNFDEKAFQQVMQVNAFAPLRVAAAFLDNVAASRQKKIVTLTSRAGSLGAVERSHEHYFYRMSKSASNMSMRLLQNDVRDRGVVVGLISPGPVDTQMNRAWRQGAPPPASLLSPMQSAAAMIKVIDALTPQRAAHALNVDGSELPW